MFILYNSVVKTMNENTMTHVYYIERKTKVANFSLSKLKLILSILLVKQWY